VLITELFLFDDLERRVI